MNNDFPKIIVSQKALVGWQGPCFQGTVDLLFKKFLSNFKTFFVALYRLSTLPDLFLLLDSMFF